MTQPCPNGHQSDADDYCSVCGLKMGVSRVHAAVPRSPDPAITSGRTDGGGEAPASVTTGSCPVCRETTLPSDKFCERCGADLTAPPPAPPAPVPPVSESPATEVTTAEWEAVTRADREYFERFVPHGIEFPADQPERRFPLQGSEVSIGRPSRSTGRSPTIDLSVPPEDPAISRQHAILMRQPDETWALVDPGSTNGVFLDDADGPVAQNVAVPLSDGAEIHLGAWTTITVRRIPPGGPDHPHLPC